MKIGNLLKQKDVGKSWGYMTQVSAQMQIFTTFSILILSAMTFYNTTLFPWMVMYGLKFPLWAFLGILIGGLGIIGLILFKFAVPSFFSAFNDQFYKHGNLLRRDVESIMKDNKAIKRDNKKILKKLDKLEKQ